MRGRERGAGGMTTYAATGSGTLWSPTAALVREALRQLTTFGDATAMNWARNRPERQAALVIGMAAIREPWAAVGSLAGKRPKTN